MSEFPVYLVKAPDDTTCVVAATDPDAARYEAIAYLPMTASPESFSVTEVPMGGYLGDEDEDTYCQRATEALEPDSLHLYRGFDRDTWAVVMAKSRRGDDGPLTRANYESAQRDLTSFAETLPGGPDAYVSECTLVGVGGEADGLTVRVLPDNITRHDRNMKHYIFPTFRRAIDLSSSLEACGILDDDLFQKYEEEEQEETWSETIWPNYCRDHGDRSTYCARTGTLGGSEFDYLDHVDSDDVFKWLRSNADSRDPSEWRDEEITRAVVEATHEYATLNQCHVPQRWWESIRDDGVFTVLDTHAHLHNGYIATVDRAAVRRALIESSDPATIPHDRELLAENGLLGDRKPLCPCGTRGCPGYDNGED